MEVLVPLKWFVIEPGAYELSVDDTMLLIFVPLQDAINAGTLPTINAVTAFNPTEQQRISASFEMPPLMLVVTDTGGARSRVQTTPSGTLRDGVFFAGEIAQVTGVETIDARRWIQVVTPPEVGGETWINIDAFPSSQIVYGDLTELQASSGDTGAVPPGAESGVPQQQDDGTVPTVQPIPGSATEGTPQ